MSVLTTLGVFNYGLVLLYGLFLSTFISGGWENTKQRTLVFAACPLFLMIQSVCWLALGADMARQLYPLITHLPLALILICILKKKVDVALVSICTAYLCCQLPRWVDLVVTALTRSELIGEICYTLVIGPLFYLLYRFFVRPAYAAMMASPQSLLLFGSLPVAYYFFDYATVVYSDALYRGYGAINEFLPTALIIFYVMFLTAYHAQSSRRAQAEEYIRKVRSDIERITPKRYCDNELVNLLCSSFAGKAQRMGVRLEVDAKLPRELSVSDTELCAVLSNALENALRAVSDQPEADRWVTLYCGVRLGKLLVEIQNPCAEGLVMRDGLPVSERAGHGYGCRSIQTIAERRGGLCEFRARGGIFSMQLVLPIKAAAKTQD